MQVILKL